MRYTEARAILSEAIEQLDEASNLRRQRSRMAHREASLIRRAGGSQEEVRDALSGKRTPTAKSGLGLLAKAYKSAGKNRSNKDPYFPYGKAETRRMSKYMD